MAVAISVTQARNPIKLRTIRAVINRCPIGDTPYRASQFWPTAPYSFNHLVGDGEQAVRHGEPERLGSLEIDREFELGRLLDWQLYRLGALQDPVHVPGAAPEQIRQGRAVGHETAGPHVLLFLAGRRCFALKSMISRMCRRIRRSPVVTNAFCCCRNMADIAAWKSSLVRIGTEISCRPSAGTAMISSSRKARFESLFGFHMNATRARPGT